MAEKTYVKYICMKCNYKFARREDSPVALRCPNCGESQLAEDEFNLNKAIKDAF